MKYLLVILAVLVFSSAAEAQVCPAGSTCNGIENYTTNAPGGAASQPYGSGLRIPVAPGATNNTMQYIQANLLATLTGTQTLTNKTISCANNTCTVRANLDLTGALAAANFPTLTGDITTPGASLATALANLAVTTAKLNTAAVTYAKMQNGASSGLLAVHNGSAPTEAVVGSGLAFDGTTLSATGGGAATGEGVAGGQSPLGMGDNATALAAGHYYYFTNATYTAPRSKNLPDSATQAVGPITAADLQQTLTSTNTLSLCAAGTDTLEGVTNGCVKLTNAGAYAKLQNDGAGKWKITGLGNLPNGTAAGQILIWDNTAKTYKAATITQGSNITVTNADGSITIAATSGSGNFTKISKQTASSSANLTWTGITSYDHYELQCEDLISATGAVDFLLQLSTSGTPVTTGYRFAGVAIQSGSSTISGDVSNSAAGLKLGSGTNSVGSRFTANLNNITTSGNTKKSSSVGTLFVSALYYMMNEASFYTGDTNAYTELKLVTSTAENIASGYCTLYGQN